MASTGYGSATRSDVGGRGYDPDSEPVVDGDGKPVRATRRYSSDIGEVLAVVEGGSPSYLFKLDELYVRAVVTSSEAAANPAYEGARQQAWTQPYGWRQKW